MRRLPFWPVLVVFLVGVLVLREPRFENFEENFLRWLVRNAQPPGKPVMLTIVEIGRDQPSKKKGEPDESATEAFLHGGGAAISPLEYALFLQSILEFQPTVVAFENVLKWRERDKDQEQVFLDQAMRVPKLLLGAELTNTPDPDQAPPEIPSFTQVTGNRSQLAEFTGVGRQPNEDMRLISTLGFINLPEEIGDDLRVPLLFRYRGEVVPSFALEAFLLSRKVTAGEVKVELPSRIVLPGDEKIPIHADGTVLVNPMAENAARRIALNQLLLAAQQRGQGGKTTAHLEDIRDHIVLARTPANPLAPPDVFAATIATLQSKTYLRRVNRVFDFCILALAIVAGLFIERIGRAYVVLAAIALTAAYCLIALNLISRWLIWLPGFFPIGIIWLLVLFRLFQGRKTARIGSAMERT